jgi:class 3 adenylate cyclase/tetratricopeptide (TPR) repeat protein
MKCPKCQFENPGGLKFCGECGAKLERVCPNCNSANPAQFKFCGECGYNLNATALRSEELSPDEKRVSESEGERRYVTAMFSDLSGYTAMSEKLDPEEIKEIMNRIFGEIAQVVTKYEGFIEKFIGDAVVAFFGVPTAHEDDPVRAIKAAREIHEVAAAMSPEVEKRTGKPISMHTGINTGLVVTGEVSMEKGTHGLAGDPINVAARLSSLAKAGELLVGHDTYRQAEGHFTFEDLEPTTLKGKAEPVHIHKVMSPKERPVTIHRLSGLKARLIGRKAELTQLKEAVEQLRKGRGRIFSICGDAGTGKSRLIEEFKNSLDLKAIQWIEGHAYAYSQNIPYFPLIDLLNRVLRIEEGDSPEKVKEKVESGIERLVGKKESIVPFVGSLYSLRYPEVEDVSPEFWKSRLRGAIQTILSALAKKAPTIFFHEDLHWADPSFMELLRKTLTEIQEPAIVLCAYRPTFSLFTSHQIGSMGKVYQEIRLQDFSLSEAEDMLESLLSTESIPNDLKRFVQAKAEGNPFYLEELINTLIESKALVRDNGSWKIARTIAESDISPTIHGLISGRLDRLEKETKRILQEASVIGRAFLYDILKRITGFHDRIDRGLNTLERLDFIRTTSLQAELEYMFKHPLTQEVVYNGLLKKERQDIHEQIALVMEQIFQERLPEFYETLAFHFLRGRSTVKAVKYLMLSGRKSLLRYAVEEADQYLREAFDILTSKTEKTLAEKMALIDVINDWSFVYYYIGDISKWIEVMNTHQELAESLGDDSRLGMFYALMGIANFMAGRPLGAFDYLKRALTLGEGCGDQKVVGYACTWLPWACVDLTRFNEAAAYGERAQEIASLFPSDQYLYFKSSGGLGYLRWVQGDFRKAGEIEKSLLAYGEKTANSRSKAIGYWINSFCQFLLGDIPASLMSSEKSVEASRDPTYLQFGRICFGAAYLAAGDFAQAEKHLKACEDFCEKGGCHAFLPWARIFLGPVLIAQGRMNEGMTLLEQTNEMIHATNKKICEAFYEYTLGKVFSIISAGPKPSFSIMTKNLRFLAKTVPFAYRRALEHYGRAIELARAIGENSVLCVAYLDLGLFHKRNKENEQAKECLKAAIELLEESGASPNLERARDALASLG